MEAARVAGAGDLDEIAALEESARGALEGVRGGDVFLATRAPLAPGLGRVLDDKGKLVLVGTLDGTIVGFAVSRVLPDRPDIADIEALYVLPDARGVGVGAALMDGLMSWAGERGCTGLDAVALPGDRATKNFFESYGLVARAILVHRKLP